MDQFLASFLIYFVPEKCVNKYLNGTDLFNFDCFKILLSKVLGYGIILGAVFVKLPQLMKIVASGSARGLSISGLLLELICCVGTSAYSYYQGFAFSTYGDAVFLTIQTAIITFLAISWEISYREGFIFLSGLVACISYTTSPLIPFKILALMQIMNTPIIMFARGLQIWKNYSEGSTGQLSAISIWLMAAGSIARIFTSIQETGDMLVIVNYVASTSVNLIISAQIVYYWNSAGARKEEELKKKK